MIPETLPLTSLKKNYEFLWTLCIDFSKPSQILFSNATGLNMAACIYVSQLAEKVQIPDDEVEYDTVNIANLEYKVPKRIKMNDLVVTYLDDSINSVYQFHKTWMMKLRQSNGLSLESMYSYPLKGLYVTLDKTLTAAEYLTLFKGIGGLTSSSSILSAISTKLLDAYAKPTSITQYPKLFPVKISRDEADNSGDGLSKVMVTYARLPNFKGKHSACSKLKMSYNQAVQRDNALLGLK
jgi:hypothetical protein